MSRRVIDELPHELLVWRGTKALANAAWAKVEDARKALRAAGRVP